MTAFFSSFNRPLGLGLLLLIFQDYLKFGKSVTCAKYIRMTPGVMTSWGASFNPSAPSSEEPNWHRRSWAKVVIWMLVTFQPWTMKVTLNHWLRDEKPLGSTTHPQNCPVPRYRRLRIASRDQSQSSSYSCSNTSQNSPLVPFKCHLRVCETLCSTKSSKVSGQSWLMKVRS